MENKQKKVHNGHRRHVCGGCGKKRKECFMSPLTFRSTYDNRVYHKKTRYGNQIWFCHVGDQNCRDKAIQNIY